MRATDLLSKHGMQYHATNPDIGNLDKAYFGRAKDVYHQEAFSEINNPDSKLRTYATLKQSIGREAYLDQIRNTKRRQKLTRFRLSNHKLMIEVGRHMRPKLNREERICQICEKAVEDEVHLLVACKFYETLRKPMFDLCEELRPQFKYYSDEEKFIFIMTTPLLMHHVSKFLENALDIRENRLEAKAAIERILDKIAKSNP